MVIILMGVSGAGKTTIGKRLAEALGGSFYDGDDFHPLANIEKMSRGIALTDTDRGPWLDSLRWRIGTWLTDGKPVILACSALKRAYRHVLSHGLDAVYFVYLKGDYDLILKRLEARLGHYMRVDLLASQFDTLEEPDDALTIDIAQAPGAIVEHLQQYFSGHVTSADTLC